MTIPQEIVKKMEAANALIEEVREWLLDNDVEFEGTKYEGTGEYFAFTEFPKGEEQFDGEYCLQHQGFCEDCFYGTYYYPTYDGKYFMIDFDI